MKRLRRALLLTLLGATGGTIAAWAAYQVRGTVKPLVNTASLTVKVDDLTLSNDRWAIVGLVLLGVLVCGSIAAAYVAKKGPVRSLTAGLVAASLGGVSCWGARWVMDQMIYARLGGPSAQVDLLEATGATLLPYLAWQVLVALGLTMPVTIAVGLNRFTLLRGLIGAGFVIVFGQVFSVIAGVVVAVLLIGSIASGNITAASGSSYAQFGDILYLFSMGAGAGLAFAVAEVVYKPAWLKSRAGSTEGRTWALNRQFSRIGCFEGSEVRLPVDGTVAPAHAQIQGDDDGHWVTDLVGNTFVNGTPVTTAWLKDGDEIAVGSHRLHYRTRLGGPERPAPAPVRAVELPTQGVSPRLVLVDPLGNSHELEDGVHIVGRDPGCKIALTWEQSVSRQHAELRLEGGTIQLRDLGSTNGTFVGDQQVTSAVPIEPGCTLTFGRAQCSVRTCP